MQTVRQNNHQSFRTTVTHFVSSFARSLASKSQSITSFHTGNQAATMPMDSPSPLPGTIVQHLDAGDQISQLHFLSPTPNSTLHPSLQDGNETICNKPKRRDCTKCHHRNRRAVRFAHGIASRQHHYHGTHVAPGTSAYDTNRV